MRRFLVLADGEHKIAPLSERIALCCAEHAQDDSPFVLFLDTEILAWVKEVEQLEAEVKASERALEISRGQTKDAFERVAIEHNENVAAQNEIRRAIAFYDKRKSDWVSVVTYIGIRHLFGGWFEQLRSVRPGR